MAQFSKGDKVIRISSKDKGIIVSIGPCGRGGRQLYKVSFNGVETDELEGNLMPDYNMNDPFERCRNRIYGSFTEFSKINTTFKIRNSNVNTISSLKASKTLFRAYQFKPLLKFLNSDNKRILVADEVGLGKTIEAGHIMLEQKARKEFKNALIICPISLQQKWKKELEDKFGLTFTIVESNKELIRMLQANDGLVRVIINYEKIRSTTQDDGAGEGNKLLKFLTESGKSFSFILCDEAHKMRNENTQTYKGAEQLMRMGDAVVFLTATPIMIGERNLYNLLHLLDDQRYSNYAIFEQGLRENAPFIKALSELSSKKSLRQIVEELCETDILYRQEINERIYTETIKVKDYFRDFPLFKRIVERMNNEEDSLTLRSQLQHDIMSMSQMNQIFSRTRKREVTTDWSQAERHPYPCIISLHENEQKAFDKVIEEYVDYNSYTDFWGDQKLTQGGALGLVQRKRQVASSVYAFLNTESNLTKGIDVYADFPDAKVDELLKIVRKVFDNGPKKIVVFALFKRTLYYLSIRLKKAGYNSVMIHGDVSNRQTVIDQFHYNDNIDILLSSEVGSEGLDMQFCNSMVNYDLPWNPMVVEQRIGRIDRFGQESPIVHIYNMIVKGSIQEDIYIRLLNRIGIFHKSIGDMEAILDVEIERNGAKDVVSLQQLYTSMEKEFFCKSLSREERLKKIDEIAQAFINEKENLKHIEEGLTNALTNDAYFRNEINRILNNNAYVTPQELQNYVEMLLKESLPTCQMEQEEDGVFTLVLPQSNPKVLSNFLLQYQPPGDENTILFKQFIYKITGKEKLHITFDQEIAYKRKDLIYINIYSPIVLAALNCFLQQDGSQTKTFFFKVKHDKLFVPVRAGMYLLGIYQVETTKTIYAIENSSSVLYPILYSKKDNAVIKDADVATAFMGQVQIAGEYSRFDISEYPDTECITNAQFEFADAIDLYRKEYLGEMQLQAENSKLMMIQQTEAYFKYRIDSMKAFIKETEDKLKFARIQGDDKAIRNQEGALRLQTSNLRILEQNLQIEKQRVIQGQDLTVRTNLLSINLIKVE